MDDVQMVRVVFQERIVLWEERRELSTAEKVRREVEKVYGRARHQGKRIKVCLCMCTERILLSLLEESIYVVVASY